MRRVIAKALTWRVIATSITAVVALGVTVRWDWAGLVAGLDAALKVAAYVIHEQVWEHDRMADRTTRQR